MLTTDMDPRVFRRALGQFPTGVTVITTTDNDKQPVGVTASSFNTVSMEPPLILWSIDKRSFSAAEAQAECGGRVQPSWNGADHRRATPGQADRQRAGRLA